MPLVGTKPAVTTDNFAKMIREEWLLVDKTLMIKDLMGNANSMWALLLFCGYLKVESSFLAADDTGRRVCQLKIPNLEITGLFNGVFSHWLKDKLGEDALQQIDKMGYEAEFKKHPHVKKLLKIGLAFSEKAVKSVYKTTSLND